MSHVEKLEEIWNSNQDKDISLVIDQCLTLIKKAQQNKENVPLALEIEIILAANYASGFGTQEDEAKQIFRLLHQVLGSKNTFDTLKLLHLATTASSVLLTAMTVDEQSNRRSANEILHQFSIQQTNSRSDIIEAMLREIEGITRNIGVSYWSLELISFGLIFLGMLQVMDDSRQINTSMNILGKPFTGSLTDQEKDEIERWNKSWTEKKDYFRFITLMIFNKHPNNEHWLNLASELIEQI
ncbi:MAG: hypothetical protein ACW98K_13575 [Candidatus Kariarchaeaceae archaeon]|jgi:chemotaxis protein histidine kinase CheA